MPVKSTGTHIFLLNIHILFWHVLYSYFVFLAFPFPVFCDAGDILGNKTIISKSLRTKQKLIIFIKMRIEYYCCFNTNISGTLPFVLQYILFGLSAASVLGWGVGGIQLIFLFS